MRYERLVLVVGLVAGSAAGCGGRLLNDVGDLNDEGRGGSSMSGAGSGGTTTSMGGMAGAGGMGGTGAGGTGAGGSSAGGGATGGADGRCDAGNGCSFEQGSNVRALTADDENLYWVEYGTSDELGNYANDGRLLARSFDSDEVRTLATGLEGPVGVAVSTAHAYVLLDSHWDDGLRSALVRLPLRGGDYETISLDRAAPRLDTCPQCFVSSGADAYWSAFGAIYRVTESSADASELVSQLSDELAVSDSHLYFPLEGGGLREAGHLWRIPLAGGEMEEVAADARDHYQISGDFVYAIDWPGAGVEYYVSRMPKEGGPWTRLVRRTGTGGYRIQISGELVFHDNFPQSETAVWEVVQGRLDDLESVQPIVELDGEAGSWIGTARGVFWTNGQGIYRRENAIP
jgi:hypothetical protein